MDSAFGTLSTSARDQPAALSASTAPDCRLLVAGPAAPSRLPQLVPCSSRLFLLLPALLLLRPLLPLSVLYCRRDHGTCILLP